METVISVVQVGFLLVALGGVLWAERIRRRQLALFLEQCRRAEVMTTIAEGHLELCGLYRAQLEAFRSGDVLRAMLLERQIARRHTGLAVLIHAYQTAGRPG